VLRAAWRALPGDLIGRAVLRLARVSITRSVAVDGVGRVDLAEEPRLGRWLDAIPRTPTAMTFGRVVLAREPLSDALVAHEAEHVRQWAALGPLYLPAYLAASVEAALRGGDRYRANRFEAAAFAAAARAAGARAAGERPVGERVSGAGAVALSAPRGNTPAGSSPAGAARDG
jgi:hypothetical protein